jgi:hypothetical protein
VYVFALLAARNKATVDPLDLTQWEFYVLPTKVLEAQCPSQKTIRLASLLRMDALKVCYRGLRDAIEPSSNDRLAAECK